MADEELARRPDARWVQHLYQQDSIDESLDLIFNNIDDLFLNGEFEYCNELLVAIDLDRLEPVILIGLLSVTLPARDKLRARADLVCRVEGILRTTMPESKIDSLLRGLR